MNIKDAYIHNGDAILKDIQLSGSELQKLKAGKKTDDTYLGWETVCDLTGIKPNTAGIADKVGHKLTFSGGVTGTWDGSADKTVAIPTKSSWNYDDVYLKLSGNGTTNPLTGTIYIKDVNGIILNSKDKDLNIWEVYGNSGVWTSQYGFNLQYVGSGYGNNNDLILWAHNQTGTHVESYRIKQDGTFIFKAAPKVGTNVMYHAGNLTASVIGGLGTLSNNISGNAATATNADTLGGVHYQNILERQGSGHSESGTATGWFRIAETLADDGASITFLLAIQRNYNYTNNESYLFSISISYNGGISITQLSGYANSRLITKIRVDWSNSQIAYIDLYINASYTNNGYYWYTVGCAKSYTTWTANPTLVGTAYEFTTVQGCKSDRGFTGDLTGTASKATDADTLDGYHATCGSNKPWGTIPVITNTGYMDVGKHFEFHCDNTTGSDYSTVLSCTGNYSNIVNLPSKSGTLALLTDNVASASKWATSRTITLTGSVTGSVSIDGSQNVSLATTTNHTHNYAGSSSAGGSANSALTLLYNNKFDTIYGDYAIFQQNYNISDFPHNGWFNSIKMLHNNSHGYFTEIATSFTGEDGMWRRALQGGSQAGWYKMLDSGNFNSYALPLSGGTLTGSVTMRGMDINLIRDIVYEGTSGWARNLITLRVDGVDKFSIAAYGNYTAGASDNGIYYGYIGCNDYNGLNLRISATTLSWGDNPLLHSANFNSYAPSLTGAGATGTWNIYITGGLTIQSIYSETDINSNYLKVYAGVGDAWTGEIRSMAYSAILGIGDPSRGFQLWAQRGDGTMGCLHYRVGTFDAHSWNTERILIDNETYNLYSPKLDGTGASGTWGISITGNAATATTSTYASNVGSSGTSGINYVTAANVISMYNWYNSITATDDASNTAIDKWNEIVSFLTGITDTSTLSGILAGYAAAGHDHDKTYLKLSGGTLTGSKNVLTLMNNSGGDIGLKFSRNFNTAWEIIDTGGNLIFNELASNTTRLVLRENSQGGSAEFKGRVSATGFSKLKSSDSYLLLGGGGHKAVSDFATASHTHSNYIERLAWWNDVDSHNADDLLSGTTFAYHNHSNCPTTGTIVAFNCINSTGYPLQLQGNYYGEELWFRNRNGDKGTWNAWRYIIHNGNIGSQSVNYASSAGNARNLLGRTTTGNDYGAVDGNLVFAEWSTYSDNRWYLKAKGYETRVGYANNSDKLDGQDLITQVSDWDTDSLSIFKSSEDSSSNAPTTDFLYGLTLRFHRDDSTYHTDLVSKLYSDALFFRRKTESGYGSWRELIHSGNISSQSVNYATNAGYATSAGNADTVDNYHLASWIYPTSPRDFTYGTRIDTDIVYNINNGDAFYMEIIGDTYFSLGSIYTIVQGYIYNGTIISYSVNNLGRVRLEHLYAMLIGDNLVFWFESLGYWQSYRIGVYKSSIGNYWKNHCTSITNSAKPTGTKEIDLCVTVSGTVHTFNNAFLDSKVSGAESADSVPWSGIIDKPTFTTWSETSSIASYSLSNASWTNTITLPTTAGSYILNIVSGNSTLTGVFSIGASDNAKDEISLHLHGNGPRLYARTNGTTLQLSSNDASATSRSVTIKYRRMI